MPTIPYHIREEDDGPVYSLRWVNSERRAVEEVEMDYRTSLQDHLIEFRSKMRTYDHLPTTIYCLYTAELYPRRYPEPDTWDAIPESDEELFVDTVLDAFSSIEQEWKSDGAEVFWYKRPEINKIIQLIERVEFGQPVAQVGGELLSYFITEHPLPNGNHRVGLSILETYLNAYEPGFDMPTTGVTGDWFDWAEEFVFESKRLMTLARKCGLLRTLAELGCEGVVRDRNNVLLFDGYDLDVSDPFGHYASGAHRERSVAFVHGILDRTDNHLLIATEDRGRRAFIESLSA